MRRLPGNVRQRIVRLVDGLSADPRPPSARELRQMQNRWRVRLDDWRVIYSIDEADSVVTVLTVRRKTGPQTYQEIEPL